MRRASLVVALVTVAAAIWVLRQRRSGHAMLPTPPNTIARTIAPDFERDDLSGRKFKLSDYKGKVVLLDFWATWCTPCRAEMPRFVEWRERYRAQGFEVVGVSMDDSAQPVHAFTRELHVNYPIVMGDENVGELYGGVLGLPINFLLDRDGRIVAKHVGATDLPQLEREIQQLLK